MTKIWDTGIDEGAPGTPTLGARNNRVISWCEANTTYGRVYVRDDGVGNRLFCYAHGDDNTWTEEILVRSNLATGRLGIQATVVDFSIAVDQTGGANDHFHIAWTTSGGALYHSELIVPNVPNNNANWTAWGGFRYQRIDNAGGACRHPSIDTDSTATGHPTVAYEVAQGGGNYQAYVNYGNGAAHAFTPAAELSLTPNRAHALYPALITVHEDTRDIYLFVNNGTLVEYYYCDKAGLPTAAPSWTAAATVLNLGIGPSTIIPSVYYWYEPGAALAQIFIVGVANNGTVHSNWYDEGNVNGWGGGWRGTTVEGGVGAGGVVQVTQVDANDFAVTYFGGTVVRFTFTDYGSNKYDVVGTTRYDASNLVPNEMSAEEKGREHDNYSYGVSHNQAGVPDFDMMFDLVRVNAKPSANTLAPDSGAYKDEQEDFDLTWVFNDPGQAQTKYRVQVDLYGTSFASPDIDSTTVTATASHTVDAFTLDFNTHYEWRLKVWDNELGDEYDPYSESDWVT